MVEYRVVAVKSRMFGDWSYAETRLQEVLDEHSVDGWRLAWIIRERNRLLVTLERTRAR